MGNCKKENLNANTIKYINNMDRIQRIGSIVTSEKLSNTKKSS